MVVTGIARTYDEAVDLYGKTSPKMILADIQLADGSSGIDAVKDILTHSAVPVIFITAFPERLLTGERPEPASGQRQNPGTLWSGEGPRQEGDIDDWYRKQDW